MKLSHAAVSYSQGRHGDYCGVCKHFEPGKPPHCELVKDPIQAKGWCEKFARLGHLEYRKGEILKAVGR